MGQMRISGLISGMDTETIIEQLVSAKRLKVTRTTGEQTKLSWKQDIWKDLNKELQKLHTSFSAKMRFSTTYQQKKTTVSNSGVASVIAGAGAMDSVQELQVSKLAKSAYLTGGKLSENKEYNALTKLKDMGIEVGSSISVSTADEALTITEETTISDVLTYYKDAGLNASFDENNQRFFVSAKTTGAEADFSFGGDNATLAALGLLTKDSDYYGTLTDQEKENFKAGSKVKGQDAVISLNGAEFTSSSNVFSINGLTITALSETKDDEVVTLTTSNDTDGIYDVVKDFLKQYNTVINKIDALYNAESVSKYEMLTDDEKDAMSEKEVEKYEDKIKEGLLRGDNTLNSIGSALRELMSKGYEVNGKTMYLSAFGISTGDYFTTEDNEKHALHIDGDPDDSMTSGKEDKLKSMIASDPDSVISFFTQLSKSMYSKMNDLSKSQSGYRTYGTFYNDIKMKSDYSDYKTRIADLEEKANKYEDKLYAQFSAMETALAKLQSSTSAITGLMGQ